MTSIGFSVIWIALALALMQMQNIELKTVGRLIINRFSTSTILAQPNERSIALLRAGAVDILGQKLTMLEKISEVDYRRPLPSFYNASVGSHFRHSLQHIQAILDRVDDQRLDKVVQYDVRTRNNELESNVDAAKAVTRTIQDRIQSLNMEQELVVSFMGPESEQFDKYYLPSTTGRELSFAVHHATHHISMAKLMMLNMSYDFGSENANIGLAPSTLKNVNTHPEKEEDKEKGETS